LQTVDLKTKLDQNVSHAYVLITLMLELSLKLFSFCIDTCCLHQNTFWIEACFYNLPLFDDDNQLEIDA
jgi:hypothetical protein